MSFLINSHQEALFNLEDDDDEFDETAYNYLFNKSTSFIDGNFVKFDHKRLEMVLENFEAIDIKMLELLNYVQMTHKPNKFKSTLLQTFSMGLT